MKYKLMVLTLALCLAASSAWAGFVFEQESGGKPITVYVQDNKLKSGSGAMGVIYDINSGTVTMLNPAEKQYWSGKPQVLEAQMDKAINARMEQMLKQVPKEQRAQMKAMMEQQMGRGKKGPEPKVTVKDLGGGPKVAGYATHHYQIFVDGQLRQDLWVGQVPGLKRDLDMQALFKVVSQMKMGGNPGWRSSQAVAKAVGQGFPLKLIDHTQMGKNVTLTKKITKKSLPADTFLPPKGWKKVDFNTMMR